ncbi:kinase-like domain-containing protein [Rhizophagus irregularis DAOM 181602=DAOM 197198]|nr:kinase-like domain-containing protein [Rhizophagus irregularis DAOM 181602=DAOM 197198]
MEDKPKNLWKNIDYYKYQAHVTVSTIDSEDVDERVVYMEDLEKRKQVYGVCGECNEPEGGYGKIYSAERPEGYIKYWDIENQKWYRHQQYSKYALKSLNDSSDISSDFLNEIKSHLQIYMFNVVRYLIMKCWNAEVKNRPSTKELYQVLNKWKDEVKDKNTELYSQIKECDKISKSKFKNRSNKDKSKNIQTHPQAIYTSRLLDFNNLPDQVNSSNPQDVYHNIQSTSANPISECLDVQLSELELDEIYQGYID